eukprot:gene24424-biopygen5918
MIKKNLFPNPLYHRAALCARRVGFASRRELARSGRNKRATAEFMEKTGSPRRHHPARGLPTDAPKPDFCGAPEPAGSRRRSESGVAGACPRTARAQQNWRKAANSVKGRTVVHVEVPDLRSAPGASIFFSCICSFRQEFRRLSQAKRTASSRAAGRQGSFTCPAARAACHSSHALRRGTQEEEEEARLPARAMALSPPLAKW